MQGPGDVQGAPVGLTIGPYGPNMISTQILKPGGMPGPGGILVGIWVVGIFVHVIVVGGIVPGIVVGGIEPGFVVGIVVGGRAVVVDWPVDRVI